MTRGNPQDWRFCVAPMMAWTDSFCRRFHRLLAPSARLYTEMLTAQAVINGQRDHLLAFDPSEHPVALQLGGADPDDLAAAARHGEAAGFDEINLNVGCPSDRVQSGRFGACLMLEPERVAECVAAMRGAVAVPVTVKTRIGVDEHDDYPFLDRFAGAVLAAGADALIVHARIAWLEGLSPKENREVPPLRYERVRRLKRDYPEAVIVANGGIRSVSEAMERLDDCDGVMLGRAAYHSPWILAELESALTGRTPPDAEAVVERMAEHARGHLVSGGRLPHVTRHMLGLFQGRPGARRWRRILSEGAHRPDADERLLGRALAALGGSGMDGRRSA